MPTLRDVANRAGVAISTASAVLNRSAPVSDRVVARVEAAVREIGYVPHAGAQSLRIGQSRVIGLILPDITNPHFAKVASIVEAACLDAGYMAAVYSTAEDDDRERQILPMMRLQRVAGLIVIPTRSDAEHGARLREQIHVPTVLLDSPVEGLPFPVVKLDNIAAGRIATEHLIALGHTRIAVTTGRANIVTGEHRLQGYLNAHAAHGLPIDRDLFLVGQFSASVAHASTLASMRRADRPNAIFSLSNMMTLGVLGALRELGLGVPDPISVIGIDDFDFASIMNPPPTVVAAPVARMAQQAIDSLFDVMADRLPSEASRIFHPELIIRDSCRPLTPQ